MPDPDGHLRIVIHTEAYEETVAQLRDVLGLHTVLNYELPGDDRVTILEAGRASVEVATTAHARAVDVIERSSEPAPQFRLALETVDAAGTAQALVSAGANPLGAPTRTPWNSLNARVALAEGIQLTLFQNLDRGPETGPRTVADQESARRTDSVGVVRSS